MLTYFYKPYTGGAGPSDELISNNNRALCQRLNEEYRILAAIELASKYHEGIDPRDDYEVVVFSLKGKTYTISYDRWGYVCDQAGDDLNQASLADVCAWLLKNI